MFNTFTEGNFKNVNNVTLEKWNRFIDSTNDGLSNEDCLLDNGIPTFDAYDKDGNLHAWYHDGTIDIISTEFFNAWYGIKQWTINQDRWLLCLSYAKCNGSLYEVNDNTIQVNDTNATFTYDGNTILTDCPNDLEQFLVHVFG